MHLLAPSIPSNFCCACPKQSTDTPLLPNDSIDPCRMHQLGSALRMMDCGEFIQMMTDLQIAAVDGDQPRFYPVCAPLCVSVSLFICHCIELVCSSCSFLCLHRAGVQQLLILVFTAALFR